MKYNGMNILAVLIITLAMMITGCSPTVQTVGSKKDAGVLEEEQDSDTQQSEDASPSDVAYVENLDVELSDADFEIDEDAEEWEGPGEDQDTSWDPEGGDKPTNTCEKQSLTECFFNSDCTNPADSCQEIDEEMPTKCCAPGSRGGLEFGANCGGHGSEDANNEACLSAMCFDNGEQAVCTQPCGEEGECPANSECVGMAGLGGVCIPDGFSL